MHAKTMAFNNVDDPKAAEVSKDTMDDMQHLTNNVSCREYIQEKAMRWEECKAFYSQSRRLDPRKVIII